MTAFYERLLQRDLSTVAIEARRLWPSWEPVEQEVP
jgi:hypothetical protein